jgi:glycosyltransferase involved in cell wall biosynthesis
MIYGEFSSAIHGPFDIDNLEGAALTGSESSFFNLARTLSERGHEVVVFCVCTRPALHRSEFQAVPIAALQGLRDIQGLDAVVAWNEPDYLAFAPAGVPRVVDQQLNDWGYCRSPNWRDLMDVIVFPSDSSRRHHEIDEGLAKAASAKVIPNSVDLDLFSGATPERHLHRVVYASSPDRGLHHLLAMWPAIRQRVPDAELKIFYRLGPWLERARDNQDEVGRRARYVEEALRRLVSADFGVEVVGAVSNREMALQFSMASVLAYPCDPVRYTEGFGCTVLDACAGSCVPVISDADALREAHRTAAIVLANAPGTRSDAWIEQIVSNLNYRPAQQDLDAMAAHAARHSRQAVTDQWETLLHELCVTRKGFRTHIQY